jgi:urease accessory protein
MEVRGRDARHLLALAWQIGNRHLAAEITRKRSGSGAITSSATC